MTNTTFPKSPSTIEETGLEPLLLRRLTTKWMMEHDSATPGEAADFIQLPKALMNLVFKDMVQAGLIESRGLRGADARSDIAYGLSQRGMAYGLESLALSRYVGPAPVTLEAFNRQILSQSIRFETFNPQELRDCLSELVLPDDFLAELGPAVGSGKSILLYGPPGNGKSAVAERIGHLFDQAIYVPHAIELAGQIVNFFDSSIHFPVDLNDEERSLDQRWRKVRRPMVKTGGELTMAMLDLAQDEYANIYEAPLHLKASGGVFIVDDFGRQQASPQQFVNRWIIPLERGYDFVTLKTGRKFRVPFDELVIFSTNFRPRDLVDEAALRRFRFKIKIDGPSKEDFLQILHNAAKQAGIRIDPDTVTHFYGEHYSGKMPPAAYHPVVLFDYIQSYCRFNNLEPVATPDLMTKAWHSLFAE